MDMFGRHGIRAGEEVDQYPNERYEHYLAEQESDEEDAVSPSQKTDIVTPLASDQSTSTDDGTENTAQSPGLLTREIQQAGDKFKLRNTMIKYAPANHPSLTGEGYFAAHARRASPSSRRTTGPHTSHNHTSAALFSANHDTPENPVRRAMSQKSTPGHSRLRSPSQSKMTFSSQSSNQRPSHNDQLVYPDQSLASLQAPNIHARPHPVLRTRSSHPGQNVLYNDIAKIHQNATMSGIRTADNTPISSPGLFSPTSMKQSSLSDSRLDNAQLHHLQAPKETHTAEIEHDVYSGNKFINNYKVMGELGRGEHGKVKLGRDVERNHYVAIKIVPRFSARRKLGAVGAQEDITKREVAILKKARHPNVVSLLEVIDDPNKNKVYLILEFVDKGEIKWRKRGIKEVLAINNQRFEQEKLGANLALEATDKELHVVHLARVRHERLEQSRRQNQVHNHVPNWSLEYAGETDDENDYTELSRTMSRQWSQVSSPSRGNSQDDFQNASNDHSLSGSLYGSYMPDANRNRKFSIAASAISHMSSEMNFEQDDDQRSYVPALSLAEARRSFRDTLLGLEFLHFIGIIHRDIKPANLLVSSSGAVKISDFGVSYLGRPITEEESEKKTSEHEASSIDNEKELARSVGTPAFWAPELCYESTEMFADGKEPKITGALDLWALGITLYCMIYARLPFYHNDQMGIHEAVCTTDVVCPRTRLVPVDTTSTEPVLRISQPINSNKRLDYEVKFEVVPDDLRDLINKLLTKDPAHRITIADAKNHPWVTQDMADATEFFQNPEIAKESKKKIMEVSDKEIDRAVVKRNFIEKLSNTAGKLMGSMFGRKDTRKRASTNASSAGSSTESLSPAASTASTVGKTDKVRESRRSSLRGDELLQALKSSRDPGEHHPLAQSQTASPDDGSPEPPSTGYFDGHMKAASTGPILVTDLDRQGRPRAPERAVSALSTADSVMTIKPSHHHKPPISDQISLLDSTTIDASIRQRVGGLWEGTTKTLNRLASRDRRDTSSRSPTQSRPPSDNDGHSGPSLAVSNTHATGAFQSPTALRVDNKSSELSNSQLYQPKDLHHTSIRAPESDQVAFEEAQQMNQRRQIQEALSKVDAETVNKATDKSVDTCPPSPDDLTFAEMPVPLSTKVSPTDGLVGSIPTAISASTIASSVDDYGNSSVSQSISNPSIGVMSGSSSPPGDTDFHDEQKPSQRESRQRSSERETEIMRTADTITLHGRPQTPVATGKPLQAEHDYYANDCSDDEDSSDEEGIVMGGPRRH